MVRRYTPEAGDIVWLHFDPQPGHEQAGHSPALIVSPSAYNGKTGLMLCCPMTTQVKGYPFEVPIPGGSPGRGFSRPGQEPRLGSPQGPTQREGVHRRAGRRQGQDSRVGRPETPAVKRTTQRLDST
jgi:hypothetical protein